MKVNKLDMKELSESQMKSSNSQSMINLDDEDIQVTNVNKAKSGLGSVKKQVGGNSILIDDDCGVQMTSVKKMEKTEIKFEGKVESTVGVKEKLGGTKQKKITDFFTAKKK